MELKELRQWKKVHLSDLDYIVFELKELISPPALIILEGPMGAGKTTFVNTFTKNSETASPTYSIINEIKDVVHADFCRLENREDLISLEIPLYLENAQYFFVEWGKKLFPYYFNEIPEEFSYYLLEISPAASQENDENQSRNFNLSIIESRP
jgi:tRNA threonylcarbamoyladenosine biosynthesis protein TsaE